MEVRVQLTMTVAELELVDEALQMAHRRYEQIADLEERAEDREEASERMRRLAKLIEAVG